MDVGNVDELVENTQKKLLLVEKWTYCGSRKCMDRQIFHKNNSGKWVCDNCGKVFEDYK